MSKNEWNRGKRRFWGTGNIENQGFDFVEQGNKAIYFREEGETETPLGGFQRC